MIKYVVSFLIVYSILAFLKADVTPLELTQEGRIEIAALSYLALLLGFFSPILKL